MAVHPAKIKISLGISSVHSSKRVCDVKMTLIICPGRGVFKMFIDNMTFHGIMAWERQRFPKHFLHCFRIFLPDRIFLCNDSDQTWFSDAFTSAGPLGMCWNIRLSGSGFQHLPWFPADVNAYITCLIPILKDNFLQIYIKWAVSWDYGTFPPP